MAAGCPTRFEAGQCEQVVDQPGHPRALLLHGSEGGLERLWVDHLSTPQHVDVPGNRGQGRPQLVRGVRDEVPHLLLGLPLNLEGLVDARRHLVEGHRQRTDLVLGPGYGDPLLVIARRQLPCRGRHLLQRP